ncbi:tetratricopeptide repeat protein [Thermomonospora cellulosilytica]|uniref:Tetratricopeptide repeat protein n=1 Tax=Thermomonospora cellulosilytica TaxID=1411118 RepID=A0A7W3MZW6_9ACTN|nr:hypothetical protein [Thermomonospora cellulosilytica]MBA9004971.1 hypothetical protein [Thermomonospora cellulosilytica]
MDSDLAKAHELARAGDVAGLMRHLRFTAGRLPVRDTAPLVGRAAELMGFTDLVQAASAVAADPRSPQALYDYGYACVEHGAFALAAVALREALTLVPGEMVIVRELATALESDYRHAEAVALLAEHEALLTPWPDRYLLAYNALLAGDIDRAAREASTLPAPSDERWLPARDRLIRMVERAQAARSAGPMNARDLRGWHFAMTGGVLTTLSPFGFAAGMTGRYAYTTDSFGQCHHALLRLRAALRSAGRTPRTVSLLPDRGDRALGLAAARLLGLPAEPFHPARTDTVVVAYDLGNASDDLLSALYERVSGQILFEHATCWTNPSGVSADISTFLHQVAVAPWGERMRYTEDGEVEKLPPDDRAPEALAADILAADPTPDPGDGETPPDPDEALTAFVSKVAPLWPTQGPRRSVDSPGPVPSSRFA